MTDRALVEKKLAVIVTAVETLRRLARPDDIRRDIREERFVEHTLREVIVVEPLIRGVASTTIRRHG